MIALSEGNIHDIDYFVRVWNHAKTITELEGINPDTQYGLSGITAFVHCTEIFEAASPTSSAVS